MSNNQFQSNVITKAFLLASDIHADQRRKASIVPGAPYLSHLMEVSGIVLANGGDEIMTAAALLHDAVEDVGNETRELILEQCGPEVLSLVLECTEEGTGGAVKASWKDRKLSYLAHIRRASVGALMISVADKLQSAQELRRQFRIQEDNAFAAFVKKEYATVPERKAAVLWFHQELCKSYRVRLNELKAEPDAPAVLAGIDALLCDFEAIVELLSW